MDVEKIKRTGSGEMEIKQWYESVEYSYLIKNISTLTTKSTLTQFLVDCGEFTYPMQWDYIQGILTGESDYLFEEIS